MRLHIKERIYDAVIRLFYYVRYRKSHRKYLVLGQRQVGIGNRLIALANMYCWAGKSDITLLWMLDFWVDVGFSRLFVMKDAPNFIATSPKRRSWSRRISLPEMPGGNAEWWQFWAPSKWAEALDGGKLFMLYNRTPAWAMDLYKDFWAQLVPSQEVKARVEECQLPVGAVCVMLRNSNERGDTAGVAVPLRFLDAMDEYPPDTAFFVSCMNAEISALVRGRFGKRIHELPNKDYKSMIDAVADMWILGHGKEMICQYGSTFTEAAWWWGGCQSHVTAIAQDYVQKY